MHVGEQLYMQVLTHEDLLAPDNMDITITALSCTDWSAEVASLKPVRDSLYPVFGVTRVETAEQQQTCVLFMPQRVCMC